MSMIRTRFKNVLLVAPDVFPDQLLSDCKNVKRISSVNSIFPSLYTLHPDIIVLDYDYLGNDLEKVLRRIMANKFYSKLEVCCYKTSPHSKVDNFLRALGVDVIVYQEDMVKTEKGKTIFTNFNAILDASILKWAGNISSQKAAV
jgi:hypothetical protein